MTEPEEKRFEMIELENFKPNLDMIDRHNVRLKRVNKAVIYTGLTRHIKDEVQPFVRNSPLLAAAVLGLDNTAIPIPLQSKFSNIWTVHDAQEIYLDTKPTCYLIIGKSGAGAFNLGEAIAKKYNCVHLCPKNVLNDEIEQKSPTGKTWDFNMRHNKACTFDIMLKMLKTKLNSAAVQHRGYVISNLPLVTCSRNSIYFINSLNSEEAYLEIDELLFDIIRNLKKKKPKKPPDSSPHSSQNSESTGIGEIEDEQEEEEVSAADKKDDNAEEEEEEVRAELPKHILDPCANVIFNRKPHYETKEGVLLRQVQELFNLKPDIVLHITCPDLDLVTKKTFRYLNYETGKNIVGSFLKKVSPDEKIISSMYNETGKNIVDVCPNIRWPPKYQIIDYVSPPESNDLNLKYNCRPPLNFKDGAIQQICNYNKYVFPFIDKKLNDFDPKMIIELDGRTSTHQMMHNVTQRLLLLQIEPVIIPEPLMLEDPPEVLDEFWETVSQLNVIHSDVVNFKYYSSPWYNRCPVELKLRRSLIGNPRFAVMFFQHVYLLSSLDNFIRFCRNPRPFLKLKYLEPTCRVIVTGTKCSGKSMISQCLSWIFDAPVICYKTFVEKQKQHKYETFAKSILTEIIATIEDTRFQNWQRAELDRVDKLKTWTSSTLHLLSQYFPLLKKYLIYQEQLLQDEQHDVFQEQDEKLGEEEVIVTNEFIEEENFEEPAKVITPYNINFLDDFYVFKDQLSFLPFLDSVTECEKVLANSNILHQFAPNELKTIKQKPSIPLLEDEDVRKAVSEYIMLNDLEKDLEPNTEELMTEMAKLVSSIDTKTQEETNFEQSYGKYIIDGFPSSSECWEYLTDTKLIPDYTIALIENREIDQELYQYYTKVEQYTKYYEKTILLAKDPLTDTKLNSMTKTSLSELDIQIIVNYAINNALDFIFITSNANNNITKTDSTIEEEGISTEQSITLFTEDIDKFREDWDSIKLKLEGKSKCFVETELENKTDVQVIEDVLLKIRQSYCSMGEIIEGEEIADNNEDDESPKDLLNYNDPQFFCETNIYCPVAYYDYGILWKGNPEFSLSYQNKMHNFCSEEFLGLFKKNITKYQSYNHPFKKLPNLKICVIGCFGSGLTSLSKLIAKDLGLLHIDFIDIINNYVMPRHFKNVGRSYESLFLNELGDDEAVVEFQIDEENENLISDMLSNETEMRRIATNYFERGTPMPPILMQKIIKQIWFKPLTSTGFVLDGYPKLPSDVEDMIACFCIPDIVIELQSTPEVSVNRIGSQMFNTWKSQQYKAKQNAKINLVTKRKEWLHNITKQVVAKLIIEEILDNIFLSDSEHVNRLSAESTSMNADPSESSNRQILFNIYDELVQEYPEPTDDTEWENADDARERIETRVESIYETDYDNIETLKDTLWENRIKILSIDGKKPLYKVFRNTLSKLIPLKNRCESFFEQTFIVNPDIAEILISRGFYFLSKFNRLCPVYLFENPETITNSFILSKRKGTIFPVIHRAYIYFLSSEDYVTKFRTNPLKYITSDILQSYFEYPLRIGIIGTPTSGKSCLAAKLAKRYGLLYLSPGTALRYILANMPWTQTATNMFKCLKDGKTLEDDLIVKAVQTAAVEYRTVTHGFVFDGFPATPYQAKGLVKIGLYPNIIFDLAAGKRTVSTYCKNEIYHDLIKYQPPYPYSLNELRYKTWRQKRYKIRSWINDDYQNLCLLNGDQTKWKIFSDAIDELKQLTSKIHFYVSNVESSVVRAMWISNESFQERQTQYKNLCPVCFHQKVYRHSDYPVDKKGVVQYKNKFYWICETHLDLVMSYPHLYLTDDDIEIPKLPAVVKLVNPDNIIENGICLVTYAENLPAQKIERGTQDFAASYSGKTYLFCSEACLRKFLTKPHLYYDITVFKEPIKFPKLCLKNLPNIGYLEQTLGNALTEACCSVNVVRPKYPGLSFELSAFIYIALYLKTINPLMDPSKKLFYLKALKVFQARSKLILNVGLRLRSMDNPFAKYPKCHHAEPTLRPVPTDDQYICSSQIRVSSTFKQRSSNYVQMQSSITHPLKRISTITGMIPRASVQTYIIKTHNNVS